MQFVASGLERLCGVIEISNLSRQNGQEASDIMFFSETRPIFSPGARQRRYTAGKLKRNRARLDTLYIEMVTSNIIQF